MRPKLTKIEFVFHSGYIVYTATEVVGRLNFEVFDIADRKLLEGNTAQAANKTNAANLLEEALKNKG